MRPSAPSVSDIALAVGLLVLMLASMFLAPSTLGGRDPDVWAVLLCVAMAVPVLWRQHSPRVAAWATTVIWMLVVALAYPAPFTASALAVTLFGIGAFLDTREALVHGGLLLAMLTGWTLVGTVAVGAPVLSVVGTAILTALAVTLGMVHRHHQQRIEELERQQAAQERAAREATADAVRAERARIARELHDVVAHDVTVMTLQAEGARRLAAEADPRIGEALRTISDTGRGGLAEMQRMIGVLRASEQEARERVASERAAEHAGERAPMSVRPDEAADLFSPAPSLDSLHALAQRVADAGLPVELHVDVETSVPAGVQLSAYRIVQECLTNSLKHAGAGARATVRITRTDAAVDVLVEDNGRGAISEAVAGGGGHGLTGMRERAQAIGGTLEHGPRPGGGFRVHAVLDSDGAGRIASGVGA